MCAHKYIHTNIHREALWITSHAPCHRPTTASSDFVQAEEVKRLLAHFNAAKRVEAEAQKQQRAGRSKEPGGAKQEAAADNIAAAAAANSGAGNSYSSASSAEERVRGPIPWGGMGANFLSAALVGGGVCRLRPAACEQRWRWQRDER